MDIKEETMHFYDQIAEQSFKDWFNNNTLLPCLKQFMNHLLENPIVLDLGCGTGGESKRLLELNASVIGIDLSKKSIELAKKNVPGAEFYIMDIHKMVFIPETFHGVVEAGVLFHFNKDEQNKILKSIFNILKPNGIFLSFYPEGNFEGIQEIQLNNDLYRRYSRFISIKEWINQTQKVGFKKYEALEFSYENFRAIEFYK